MQITHDTDETARPAPIGFVPTFGLTPRELDVVAAVRLGDSNRAIARRLAVAEDTVKHHLSSVFGKIGVRSRLELAVFAMEHRLGEDAFAAYNER